MTEMAGSVCISNHKIENILSRHFLVDKCAESSNSF